MARKREDKANKDSRKPQKSRPASDNSCQDKNFLSLKHQLSAMKLTLREIPGDGNCLFGALADQLDGTPKTHMKHRQEVVTYMRNHREDFEPFVEDDEPFEKHLSNLAELGTYGGNECIVAFARLNGVKVVIHQLNAPLWQIDGSNAKENAKELHISYHNGDHYNSVRRTGDSTSNPSNIKLSVKTSSRDEGSNKKKCSKGFSEGKALPYYFDSVCDSFGECVEESVVPSGSCDDQNCQYIVDRTGCEDIDTVRHFLIANDFVVSDTIDALLNYIIHEHKGESPMTVSRSWEGSSDKDSQSSWHESEREGQSYDKTPLIDSSNDCFKEPKKSVHELCQEKLRNSSLSNAKRKELKKQIRKHQRNEKKRHQAQNGTYSEESSCWGSGDDHETIIVRDIGCLSI